MLGAIGVCRDPTRDQRINEILDKLPVDLLDRYVPGEGDLADRRVDFVKASKTLRNIEGHGKEAQRVVYGIDLSDVVTTWLTFLVALALIECGVDSAVVAKAITRKYQYRWA